MSPVALSRVLSHPGVLSGERQSSLTNNNSGGRDKSSASFAALGGRVIIAYQRLSSRELASTGVIAAGVFCSFRKHVSHLAASTRAERLGDA